MGANLELAVRAADIGNDASYPERAAELASARPDVLVASGTAPATALARAALDVTDGTVPVVFIAVGGPVEIGLVESLARPGRNVTGLASFRPDPGEQAPGTAQGGSTRRDATGGALEPIQRRRRGGVVHDAGGCTPARA